MKKGAMLLTIVISTLLLAAGLFVFTADYEKNAKAFPDATVINGVDCSGMSGEETIAALTDARNNAILTVVEDGEEIGQITGIQVTYDIAPQVNKLLHGNILRLPMPKFMPGNLGVAKSVDMVVPGFASYETLLYSPELKFYSNRIKMDADFNTSVKGLHCLGDSSGWTRGLMMASVMGVRMGRILAEKE